MMTRRDFELIARVLALLPVRVREEALPHFAAVLQMENPAFNREKFYKACRKGGDPN